MAISRYELQLRPLALSCEKHFSTRHKSRCFYESQFFSTLDCLKHVLECLEMSYERIAVEKSQLHKIPL